MADSDRKRIAELEDELKAKDRRITELREEIDELRELVREMEENVEDADNTIEQWIDAFDMELDENGEWSWDPFIEQAHEISRKHRDLVRRWNRHITAFNLQPVGRPLGASEAQVGQAHKLRKAGKSLRWIAEETNLSLRTVRTIVGKHAGTDRTTSKHRGRIAIDRQEEARWDRQKRAIDALPRRAQHVVEQGKALIKRAKGLG